MWWCSTPTAFYVPPPPLSLEQKISGRLEHEKHPGFGLSYRLRKPLGPVRRIVVNRDPFRRLRRFGLSEEHGRISHAASTRRVPIDGGSGRAQPTDRSDDGGSGRAQPDRLAEKDTHGFKRPRSEERLDTVDLRHEPPPLVSPLPDSDDDEDEGFVLINEAQGRITKLEMRSRCFIDEQMTVAFGPDWPKRRLPNGMYDKWSVFKPFFGRKEDVRESFQRLCPVRVATMHARQITQDDALLLYLETRRLWNVSDHRKTYFFGLSPTGHRSRQPRLWRGIGGNGSVQRLNRPQIEHRQRVGERRGAGELIVPPP